MELNLISKFVSGKISSFVQIVNPDFQLDCREKCVPSTKRKNNSRICCSFLAQGMFNLRDVWNVSGQESKAISSLVVYIFLIYISLYMIKQSLLKSFQWECYYNDIIKWCKFTVMTSLMQNTSLSYYEYINVWKL